MPSRSSDGSALLRGGRTLWDRVTHHRLVAIFVAVTLLHALLQALLQGEAFQTSKNGEAVLRDIRAAPQLGIAVAESHFVGASSVLIFSGSTSDSPPATTSPPLPSTTAIQSFSSTSTSTRTATQTASPLTKTAGLATPTSLHRSTTSTSTVQVTSVPISVLPPQTTLSSSNEEAEERAETAKEEAEEDRKESLKGASRITSIVATPARQLKVRQSIQSEVSNATLFAVPSVHDLEGHTLAVTSQCASAIGGVLIYIMHLEEMSMAFTCFQVWVFILSFTGVVYESVPHIATVLISHLLAIVYAVYQVTQTVFFHDFFHTEIIQESCGQVNIIPGFWEEALKLETAVAVMEGVGALGVGYLLYKLRSVLQWRTFKRLGADRQTSRQHYIGLCFEIFLQLSAFWIITFQALWLHELCTFDWTSSGYNKATTIELSMAYKVFLGVLTGLIVPWLITGYIGLHQGRQALMAVFLVGNLLVLGHSLFLTTRETFINTQHTFKFLTFVGSVASFVSVLTLILGCCFLLGLIRQRKHLPIEWVASFPTEGPEYDLEKGFSDQKEIAGSISHPPSLPMSAPSQHTPPLQQPLAVAFVPRHNTSYKAGDDVLSLSLKPTQDDDPSKALHIPPLLIAPTPLQRNPPGGRKPPPSAIKVSKGKVIAVAVGDEESEIEKMASFGAPPSSRRGRQDKLVSRWSNSTKTGVSSSAPYSEGSRVSRALSTWTE